MTNTWFDIQKENLKENDELINIFDDEPMQSYQLSTIYEFYECRNSYNASLSKIAMFNNFGFHYSFKTIKERIEANRKKGSYFEVHEVPCIALKGESKALIVFPKNSSIHFNTLKNKLSDKEIGIFYPRATTLKNAYKLFKLDHIEGLNVFVTDIENIIPFELPLRSYKSDNQDISYHYKFELWGESCYGWHVDSLLKSFEALNHITPKCRLIF